MAKATSTGDINVLLTREEAEFLAATLYNHITFDGSDAGDLAENIYYALESVGADGDRASPFGSEIQLNPDVVAF